MGHNNITSTTTSDLYYYIYKGFNQFKRKLIACLDLDSI